MTNAFSLEEQAQIRKPPGGSRWGGESLTRKPRQGRTRGAARRCARKHTQSALVDQPRTTQAARSALSDRSNQQTSRKPQAPTALPTLACARALISADAFMTSTSCVLLTLRSAPTSGASGLRFDVAIASRYASGSDLAARGCCRER